MFDESPSTTTTNTDTLTTKYAQTGSDVIALMDMDNVGMVRFNRYDASSVLQESILVSIPDDSTQYYFTGSNSFLPNLTGATEVVMMTREIVTASLLLVL
jgi:hypothetical protein